MGQISGDPAGLSVSVRNASDAADERAFRPACGDALRIRFTSHRARSLAVQYGLLNLNDALDRYALSQEEFDLWRNAVETHGDKALRVTTLQKYRQL